MSSAANESRTQFLSFMLAGEVYAVDILRVKEIIEFGSLTRVPAMPAAVRGVINLRGRVVPVIDLAARFGIPESPVTARTCIVMMEIGGDDDAPTVVGIIADAVCEVLDLTAGQVQPPPSFGTPIGAEFLDGLAEGAGGKFTMLLNADRALSAAVSAPEQAAGPVT
jgi:purine-binding chemotaxis protein CheW